MSRFFKLGFTGSYKLDLLNYIARICVNLGQKVAVVDASETQYMKYTIPEFKDVDCISYNGVDYFIDKGEPEKYNEVPWQSYNIVLIDYGFNNELMHLYSECQIVFAVTDFQRQHIMQLKYIVDSGYIKDTNVVKLYRDVFECKIRKKYIDHILKLEDNSKVLAEYVFERRTEDDVIKLLSQYDDRVKFKRLSKEYKEFLHDVIEEILELKPKEINRAIKLAQEASVCK